MRRITVTLPEDLVRHLDESVAKGERSRFVAEALAQAFAREGKQEAFRKLASFKPFKVKGSSVEALRSLRQGELNQREDL